MTDEPDVTDDESRPSTEERLGVLEDAVGYAHQRITGVRAVVATNEAQVVILAIGLILLAGAVWLLSREGVTDGAVTEVS